MRITDALNTLRTCTFEYNYDVSGANSSVVFTKFYRKDELGCPAGEYWSANELRELLTTLRKSKRIWRQSDADYMAEIERLLSKYA